MPSLKFSKVVPFALELFNQILLLSAFLFLNILAVFVDNHVNIDIETGDIDIDKFIDRERRTE